TRPSQQSHQRSTPKLAKPPKLQTSALLPLTSPAWYTRYGYPASCFVVSILNSNSDAASHRTLYPPPAGPRSLDDARDDRALSSASSGSGSAEWNSPENRRGGSGPPWMYVVALESRHRVMDESVLCRGMPVESTLRPVAGRGGATVAVGGWDRGVGLVSCT